MSAMFAQRSIGSLVSLDVTCRHAQWMLKSRHTRDWCVQSWSLVVQFGTPKLLLQDELEKMQKRAARFVTVNYTYETGNMTGILEQRRWKCLKKRRKDNILLILYKV